MCFMIQTRSKQRHWSSHSHHPQTVEQACQVQRSLHLIKMRIVGCGVLMSHCLNQLVKDSRWKMLLDMYMMDRRRHRHTHSVLRLLLLLLLGSRMRRMTMMIYDRRS